MRAAILRLGLVALATAHAAVALAQTPADIDKARDAFARAIVVFQHPRCTNCHNRGEGPQIGNTPRAHLSNVKRGPEGRGEGALRCAACHKSANSAGGPPGTPDWRMPPPGSAGWGGLGPAEICAALRDPARNAGLSPDQLIEHMSKDPLVAWAWAPGGIRSKPPLPLADFLDLMRTWRAGGAPCPG